MCVCERERERETEWEKSRRRDFADSGNVGKTRYRQVDARPMNGGKCVSIFMRLRKIAKTDC